MSTITWFQTSSQGGELLKLCLEFSLEKRKYKINKWTHGIRIPCLGIVAKRCYPRWAQVWILARPNSIWIWSPLHTNLKVKIEFSWGPKSRIWLLGHTYKRKRKPCVEVDVRSKRDARRSKKPPKELREKPTYVRRPLRLRKIRKILKPREAIRREFCLVVICAVSLYPIELLFIHLGFGVKSRCGKHLSDWAIVNSDSPILVDYLLLALPVDVGTDTRTEPRKFLVSWFFSFISLVISRWRKLQDPVVSADLHEATWGICYSG